MCEDWQRFEPFQTWASANGYLEGLTIERKENSLGYNPSNCTWIPRKEQPLNQRFNVGVSGYRGVSAHGGGWKAQVKVDGKKHNLGTFVTAHEAAIVRAKFVTDHKLNRQLNFGVTREDSN